MPQSFNLEGIPLELLDVGELALIHNNYRPMDTWLLDQLFPNRPVFDRDDVPLAEVTAEHDLAPLVSPQQPGKPFDTTQSGEVRTVKPAYYKPKNQVTPAETFEIALLERLRTAGIISTGNQKLSDQEKMLISQVAVMKRNHDAIDNSVLMMAIDLLKNGKYTLHSDDYEYNLVNYRRDASLIFTPAKVNKLGLQWDVTVTGRHAASQLSNGSRAIDQAGELLEKVIILLSGWQPASSKDPLKLIRISEEFSSTCVYVTAIFESTKFITQE